MRAVDRCMLLSVREGRCSRALGRIVLLEVHEESCWRAFGRTVMLEVREDAFVLLDDLPECSDSRQPVEWLGKGAAWRM